MLSVLSSLRTNRKRSPERCRGDGTRKDTAQFPHGGAVCRRHRRLLLGRWSILTFCRVTSVYSFLGEAIVGGLMCSLLRAARSQRPAMRAAFTSSILSARAVTDRMSG